MKKLTTLFILLTSLFSMSAAAVAGDVYVYVNSTNTEEIDIKTLRKIVQSNRLSWKNGQNIVLITEELSGMDDADFSEMTEISKSQFLNNWRLKFFSGRALVPIQLKKSVNPLDTLKENPSSIFFTFKALPEDSISNQIKTLKLSY